MAPHTVLAHEVLQSVLEGNGHVEAVAERIGTSPGVAAQEIGALYAAGQLTYVVGGGYSLTSAGVAQLAAWDRDHGPVVSTVDGAAS